MKVFAIIAAGASVLALTPAVQGHGYIVEPAAQWADGYPNNGYGSTVDNEIWGAVDNSKYGYGPNGTLNFFKATFPEKGYNSLGALITKNQELYSDKVDPDCGLTIYKDSVRSELPAKELKHTGFTHTGPCEVWCDDTKVLFDYDCQTKYNNIPATMPYDESKCANANRLTIYWLALHGDPWQVYTDCAWLKGGSGIGKPPSPVGAGASTDAGSTAPSTGTTTTAPSTETTLPPASEEIGAEASAADESEASSAATPPSVEETYAPTTEAPTTDAPTTAPDTPAATSEKCAVRRRQ